MRKFWIVFLLILVAGTASADEVRKTFHVGVDEWVNVTISRQDGVVYADIHAGSKTYALMSDFTIRQKGWEYSIITDFMFYDEEGESVFSVVFGETKYLTIEKGFSEDSDLRLAKEFDLVNTARIDKPFLTVPAESGGGGGGGGCFVGAMR